MSRTISSSMATPNHLFIPALLLLLFLSLDFTAAQIGVAYGRDGNGLPPPSNVVATFIRYGIKRMRIYDPHPPTLQALGNSRIELTVGAPNVDLQRLTDPATAAGWVRDNIQNYPNVIFKHVVVGNEVSPIRNPELAQFVVPAMQNIRNALVAAGLDRISVSTAVETEVLDPSKNFPPSMGEFRPEVKDYMRSVLQFLVNNNAPLFTNIYPYFAYKSNPAQIPLNYALLERGGGINTSDGPYDNLYYALLDTMYAAVEKSGVSAAAVEQNADRRINDVEIKGSESGWPGSRGRGSAAVADQSGGEAANGQNAGTYINNLIRVVKSGTPRRPNLPIETYIFAAFDENLKDGEEEEKHFGIFQPNGDTKYPINFQ